MTRSLRLALFSSLLGLTIAFSDAPVQAQGPGFPADLHVEDTTRAPLSRKTKGVLMMVGGAVLIPVGLGVAVINSIEKCDPEMPGFGPCSDTEPNEAVATGGYVAAGGGLMLFLAGLLTLVTD